MRIRTVVQCRVAPDQQDKFEQIARQCCEAAEKEGGLMQYLWFWDDAHEHVTILEEYANDQAILRHLQGPVGTQFLPRLTEICDVLAIHVEGKVGPDAHAALEQYGASFESQIAGFTRLTTA